VDADDRFLGRAGDQAEGAARIRVEPRVVVADPFLVLNREIAPMGLLELLLIDSHESIVNVHVRWHQMLLWVVVSGGDHRRARHSGGRIHYRQEGAGAP
jgi:hypothetical protein